MENCDKLGASFPGYDSLTEDISVGHECSAECLPPVARICVHAVHRVVLSARVVRSLTLLHRIVFLVVSTVATFGRRALVAATLVALLWQSIWHLDVLNSSSFVRVRRRWR